MSTDTQQISFPKMFYKIIQKGSKVVYNELKERTNDFTVINNEEFKNNLLQILKDRNLTVYYAFLADSPIPDINKQVIGKDGCYLYKTTATHNILFVWHNRTNKQFEFWSLTRPELIHAVDAIRYRLHKLSLN